MKVLLERLENQLIGQYLRDPNVRYGIYLLGVIGKKKNKKHWIHPDSGQELTFDKVLELLQERADKIVAERNDIAKVTVIGIDFRDT